MEQKKTKAGIRWFCDCGKMAKLVTRQAYKNINSRNVLYNYLWVVCEHCGTKVNLTRLNEIEIITEEGTKL